MGDGFGVSLHLDRAVALAARATVPQQVELVAALDGQELCLCQLVELLGLATSTVSRHASILQQAQLIQARKDGRWTYFRLAQESNAIADDANSLVLSRLQRDAQIRADRKQLKRILRLDPEDLCRKQSEGKCKC